MLLRLKNDEYAQRFSLIPLVRISPYKYSFIFVVSTYGNYHYNSFDATSLFYEFVFNFRFNKRIFHTFYNKNIQLYIHNYLHTPRYNECEPSDTKWFVMRIRYTDSNVPIHWGTNICIKYAIFGAKFRRMEFTYFSSLRMFRLIA